MGGTTFLMMFCPLNVWDACLGTSVYKLECLTDSKSFSLDGLTCASLRPFKLARWENICEETTLGLVIGKKPDLFFSRLVKLALCAMTCARLAFMILW
jgi:hypothetical protein